MNPWVTHTPSQSNRYSKAYQEFMHMLAAVLFDDCQGLIRVNRSSTWAELEGGRTVLLIVKTL